MAKRKSTAAESVTEKTERRTRVEKKNDALRAASEAGSSMYPDLTYAGNIIPMGGGYLGNIALINWARCAAIIQKQYDQIALSHRLHNIIRDHTLALGIDVSASVTDDGMNRFKQCLNEIVARTYSGKENRMDLKAGAYLLESSMFGELCLTSSKNPHNGKLKIGYMPVRWIEKVIPDPFDPSEASAVVLRGGVDWIVDKRNKEGGRLDFLGDRSTRKVIRYNSEPWLFDPASGKILEEKDELGLKRKIPNPDYGKLAGDVFYSRLPNLLSVDRGRGDTFAVADWINKLDQGIHDFLDRYGAQASVVFDLLIKGGTRDDIERASKMRLPTGNKPYVHNELQTLTLLAANIKIDDLTNFIRTLVVLISGTVGIPEMMLGDGNNTNVATATEQTPALYAMFNNRRTWFASFMETIMRYAIECANDAGVIYSVDEDGKKTLEKLTRKQLDAIEISTDFTPFERSNAQGLTTMLKGVVDAVLEMIQAKLISQKTGRTVSRAFLSQLGTDLDNEVEDRQIEAEQQASTRGVTPSGNQSDHKDLIGTDIPVITPEENTAIPEKGKTAEGAAGSGRIGGKIITQSLKIVKAANLTKRHRQIVKDYPNHIVTPMSWSESERRFHITPKDKSKVIAARRLKVVESE